MKTITYKLSFGREGYATLAATSCWHIDNNSIHREGIKTFLAHVGRHRYPWVHKGDLIEAILPNDERFDLTTHKSSFLACGEDAARLIKKARATCLGIMVGNHDWKAARKVGNITAVIAKDAQVPYLGGSRRFIIKCPKGEFVWFMSHGGGNISQRSEFPERRSTNRNIALRRKLQRFRAYLKGIGHFHTSMIAPLVKQEELEEKMETHAVHDYWCYACPAMFRGYYEPDYQTQMEEPLAADIPLPSYAEMRLLDPTELGWIEIVVNKDGTIPCIRKMRETGAVKEEVRPVVVD